MYPWRRILIPTDFSTASQWAFDDAAHQAGVTGAELLILHIRMTRNSNPAELRFPADTALYDYAEEHELERLRERVQRAHASVATRLVVKLAPDPGGEIGRTAKEENADLIVVSTHARHHVAHLLIGSTTMAVISDPPAPVLAIRYGVRKARGMKKIVVPLHPEQTSSAALKLASAMAIRERSEIHLVTICDGTNRAEAETHLEGVDLEGVTVKRSIISGTKVEREIIRYLESSGADALFVNASKAIGQVKNDIIRYAGVPVMLVPAVP